MTGELEGDFAKTVSLGQNQIQRLALAAESLAEEQSEFDPEFAAKLRADAEDLNHAAAAGTVRMDEGIDAPAIDFSAALDD